MSSCDTSGLPSKPALEPRPSRPGRSVFPETPNRTAHTLTDLARDPSGVLLQNHQPIEQ